MPPKAKDKKVKAILKKVKNDTADAKRKAAETEALFLETSGFLEPENEMEKTFKVRQSEIIDSVDSSTQNKKISLKLQLGPYKADVSRSGNYFLLGGAKGHIASFNWKTGVQEAEIFVNESVHSVKYLNDDHLFFAAAQKKYTFVYDNNGTELHKLTHHIEARHLEYLPYHYLLVSAGNTGFIKYQDVSTGQLVAELRSKLGPTASLCQNPANAVVLSGHNNGTVCLWAPASSQPLVKLQNSSGPVRAVAVDRSGNYMAAAGADRSLKVWDLRTFKTIESYYSPTPASSLSISDTGLLGVGWGPHVQVWKDVLKRGGEKASTPYLNHLLPGSKIESVRFCPFEDVLCVGHQDGLDTVIVPGAGEANIDSMEANPFMYATRTGRREAQVRGLLEKLQPDMISLDPDFIGNVDLRSASERLSAPQRVLHEEEKAAEEKAKLNPRTNVKSKNSGVRRLLRKKTKNVMDQRKLRLQAALETEKRARHKERNPDASDDIALKRFG